MRKLFVMNKDELNIQDEKTEYTFFRILLMAIILNQPRFFLEKLCGLEPSHMFREAKKEDVQFSQYHEWISDQIAKYTYDPLNRFVELESFNTSKVSIREEPVWLRKIMDLF